MSEIEICLTVPEGEPGIAEYGRAFCVEGIIRAVSSLPTNAQMTLRLSDVLGNVVRWIFCPQKNMPCYLPYPGLTGYPRGMDDDFAGLRSFGFPPLAVRDSEQPEDSLHDATAKLWFSDTCFKGFFVSASDIEHGAVWNDGFGFTDENGFPLTALPIGDYTVTAVLSDGETVLAEAKKEIRILRRENQLICRFHPVSHKHRVADWCEAKNITVIREPLPGYLDPYLGTWYYHMGLLPMYRANDIALFENTTVRMFVYLVDPTSTSYETELAYLQERRLVGNADRFHAYYYDIGEPILHLRNGRTQTATITEFPNDTYLVLTRADDVADTACDNRLEITEEIRPSSHIAGSSFALMGVIRPWQMNPKDFIHRDDNTYRIHNAPGSIRYRFTVNGNVTTVTRPVGLERFENGVSIGSSVFEFYHVLHLDESWSGQKLLLEAECLDLRGEKTPCHTTLQWNIQ